MSETIRCEMCNREFGSQEAIDSHNKAKHSHDEKHTHEAKSHAFPIKTVSIIGIILFIALSFAAFSFANHKPADSAANNPVSGIQNIQTSDNVQTATLRVSGSSYILEPSTFKKDVPVKIIADINSMPGCSKVVTIPSFRILKTVSNSDNIITFTPTQAGSFKIACSMNMYTGTFKVI